MTARPDAGRPLPGDGMTLYPPAGGVGAYTAVPDRLSLERRPDGRPDLLLEVVRSFGAGLILRYGVLDLRVSAGADLDLAARTLAGARPVRGAVWSDGAIRFAVPGRPVSPVHALIGDGLGGLRCTQWIDADAAGVLDGMLTAGVLALDVRAELEMEAVPPRVPATVRFVPAELLTALGQGLHPWDGLGSELMTIVGDPTDSKQFGLAVAARLRAAYGAFAVDPERIGRPSFTLRAPAAGDETEVVWDLRAEVVAPLPVVLALDAGAAMAEPLRQHGVDAFRRFVDVPPLHTGFRQVSVIGNLPGPRDGAVLGVRLRRPPAIDEFVELLAPDDRGSVLLRFSPADPPEVAVSTVAHLRDRPGTPLEGLATPTAASAVLIGPDDFDVRFLTVAAVPALLEQASLTVTVTWKGTDGPRSWPALLDVTSPGRTLVLPADTVVGRAEVVATGSGRTARIDLPADGPIARFHFPFYGANAVPVRCRAALTAVEFQPEDATGTTRLTFTADRPESTFRWFSGSVFATGYRYRVLAPDGIPGPWSAIQPPGRPLELPDQTGDPMPGDDEVEVSGVRFHRDPDDPARAWFEPGPPDVVRTRGRAQVFLTDLPDRVALQVAACLPPTGEQLEELRPALAARLGLANPDLLKLAPRPSRVGPAELRMVAEDRVVASAWPASVPPFRAILSTTVDGKAADRVRAAFAGERGEVEVGYAVEHEQPTTVTATCEGDVAAALAHLGPDLEAEVGRLIEAGLLTLTCTAVPLAAPPEVTGRLTAEARTAAARALRPMTTNRISGGTRISAVVTEVVFVALPGDLRADVAGWTTPAP